jgi:hypothetical protein
MNGLGQHGIKEPKVAAHMKNFVFVFILLFGASAFSQDINSTNFVIDPAKPYVYLKFDHIGPRKPHQDGEISTGLWLKVVNNCRIPIVLRASGGLLGDIEAVLEDEVVEDEPIMQIIGSDLEMKEFERDLKLRRDRLKNKPEGYSFEVSGVATVQPGTEILISFPLNHVDDHWYLRVKFALKLNNSSVAVGPFTYLPFYKLDIPKDEKQGESQSAQQLRK